MKSLSEQIAWLAAFYEGEGTIKGGVYWNPSSNKNQRTLQFSITQKDIYPLEVCRVILLNAGIPEKHIKLGLKDKKREIYSLRICSFKAIESVCKLMWDNLSPRRKAQIQTAFLIYCDDYKAAGHILHRVEKAAAVDSDLCDEDVDDTILRRISG